MGTMTTSQDWHHLLLSTMCTHNVFVSGIPPHHKPRAERTRAGVRISRPRRATPQRTDAGRRPTKPHRRNRHFDVATPNVGSLEVERSIPPHSHPFPLAVIPSHCDGSGSVAEQHRGGRRRRFHRQSSGVRTQVRTGPTRNAPIAGTDILQRGHDDAVPAG